MLPRSTHTRSGRAAGGRGQEIQRLIGRSLRAADRHARARPAPDHRRLRRHPGRRRHAHGGDHRRLGRAGAGGAAPGRRPARSRPIRMRLAVAAISTGIIDGEARVDLPYVEDSQAEVDCNFVMTGDGRFVEVQATAEKGAFSAEQYAALVALAAAGDADAVRPPARGAGARAAVEGRRLASRNRGKLREIVPLLAGLGFDLVTIDERRARLRAARGRRHVRGQRAREGAPGRRGDRPGRHRRRFGAGGRRARRRAGRLFGALRRAYRRTTPRNNAKLLEALRDVPASRRRARFRCVAAFVDPGAGVELARSGDCEGEILDAAAGRPGLRLRSAVPGPGAGAHDGGAAARREEPAVSSRGRVPGAGRRAARVAQRRSRVEDQRHRADQQRGEADARRARATAAAASRARRLRLPPARAPPARGVLVVAVPGRTSRATRPPSASPSAVSRGGLGAWSIRHRTIIQYRPARLCARVCAASRGVAARVSVSI